MCLKILKLMCMFVNSMSGFMDLSYYVANQLHYPCNYRQEPKISTSLYVYHKSLDTVVTILMSLFFFFLQLDLTLHLGHTR